MNRDEVIARMTAPTVSLVLTINNRTPEVCKQVADSFRLPGNAVDETIIVLDRCAPDVAAGARAAYGDFPHVKFVDIGGDPGWICPAAAWNAGYKAATGDYLYVISSEVVQEAGNVYKARALANPDTIIFGACHNSVANQQVMGAEPGLLVSSRMPRPLGFIAVIPRRSMVEVGGNDLAFMGGLWYEDDDLYLRLWRSGLDFHFDDSIHGTHLDHDRPNLSTPDGAARIARNKRLMEIKHGHANVWPSLAKLVTVTPTTCTWSHI